MSAGDTPIDQRLADLDRRLARVETHLGLATLDPTSGNAAHAPGTPWLSRVTEKAVARRHIAAEELPEIPLPDPLQVVAPEPPPIPKSVAPAPVPPPIPPRATRPVVPAYAPALAARIPPPQNELEQTIGLKWAGWVGAVVVVIGAAMGIKYAYDQHWFEVLPPAGRLALMSIFGFALIGAGEVVMRRVHRFAAASLFGAGVATLFLVSYAGFGYYQLYEQQTAFVLMALSTVVGAAVAMRGRMVSIAALAQIGGNLAPVLLRSDHPQLVPFLSYLLTLQVVALVLAWWGGGGRWWTLRGLSLATTSLWLFAVLGDWRFDNGLASKLTFCMIYAGLYQAELVLSAWRAPRPAAQDDRSELPTDIPAGGWVVFSMLVTALLTTATIVILRDVADPVRGVWVLGLAGFCAAAGFGLTTGRRGASRSDELGTGFRIQAAALVVVAVPVALSGIWVVLGWGVLALAFAVLGRTLDLRVSRWAGVMVWRLAILYLVWWTIGAGGEDHRKAAHEAWLHLFGAAVPAYVVLAWQLTAIGHAVAWIVARPAALVDGAPADAAPENPEGTYHRLTWVTHATAGIVWVTASIAALPPAGATLAILVYAWLLLGLDLVNPRIGLVLQSAAVVALATVKWMAVDTLADRLSPGWSATARQPIFNAVMGVGVLISLTMGALYALRRDVLWAALTRRIDDDRVVGFSPATPAIALAAVLVFVMTVGLSFEIDRVIEAAAGVRVWPAGQYKQMAWTVLWMVSACGFLALARRLEPDLRRRPGWVHAAEVLALLLAAKFLLVDTLAFRALHRPSVAAAAVANFQTLTALVVVAGLILVSYLMTRRATGDDAEAGGRAVFAIAGFLAVLVVLWGGTLEIDRWFERMIATGSGTFADPRLAKQVAFSIFWSVFAVAAVIAGFRFRIRGLRYFGLGLFAVTLAKVLLVDTSQVQTGYRVLSFMGLGLLLLGTSVLYGKLSPVLLREPDHEPATP